MNYRGVHFFDNLLLVAAMTLIYTAFVRNNTSYTELIGMFYSLRSVWTGLSRAARHDWLATVSRATTTATAAASANIHTDNSTR